MPAFLAIFCLLFLSVQAYGQAVVIPDSVVLAGAPGGRDASGFVDFEVTVFQDVFLQDFTQSFFNVSSFFLGPVPTGPFGPFGSAFGPPIVDFVSLNVDEGTDWFFVEKGAAFGGAGLPGSFIEELPSVFSDQPALTIPGQSKTVLPDAPENAIDFYLGFATNSTGGFDVPRDIFGWALFRTSLENFVVLEDQPLEPFITAVGLDLELLDSATAFGASGIVVGSNVAVPEPSSAMIYAVAVSLVFVCRVRSIGGFLSVRD